MKEGVRQQKGTEQSALGPIRPGRFRTCLDLEVGQGHPRLRGEAWPARQNPMPSTLPYPDLPTHLAQSWPS